MRRFLLFLLISVLVVAVTSCKSDDDDDKSLVDKVNPKTTIVFMPWTGSATDDGLYRAFQKNLDSIESAIVRAQGINGRMMVFLSTSATRSSLYEVTYDEKTQSIVHTTKKDYTGNSYNSAAGITEIMKDVMDNAEALNYSLIIGCHGCGWTYKDDWNNYPYNAKQHTAWRMGSAQAKDQPSAQAKAHPVMMAGPYPTTRYFGSVSDKAYSLDIETLVDGLKGAGFGSESNKLDGKKLLMQYILFDDCYMANIETAYALKDVTNFLICSTSEILATGMPYASIWSYLESSTPNYSSIVSGFNTFYSSYTVSSGALSAIDCREVGGLAALMKEINHRYRISDATVSRLQVLDGYNVPLFYDMGDYVDSLCTDDSWRSDFHDQLDKVVPYTSHTNSIYTYIYSVPYFFPVTRYSGITISDPSQNPVALRGKEKTAWWRDTH